MQTLPLAYPNPATLSDNDSVQYKIIIGSPLTEMATPDEIYAFLHEVIGHDILGEKHFRQNTAADRKPFANTPLDCSQTVTAYPTDCKSWVMASIKLLGRKTLNKFDPSLSVKDLAIIREIDNALPTTMGTLDEQLATEWIKEIEACSNDSEVHSGIFFSTPNNRRKNRNIKPINHLKQGEFYGDMIA